MLWGNPDKNMALSWWHEQRRLQSNAIPSVKYVPSLFQWHNPMLTKRLFCKEWFLQIPVQHWGNHLFKNPTYMFREYNLSVWLVLATNVLLFAKLLWTSSSCRVYFICVCLFVVANSLVSVKCMHGIFSLCMSRCGCKFPPSWPQHVPLPGLQLLWWQTSNMVCNANVSSSKKSYLPIIGSSTLHGSLIVLNKDWKVLWIHSIHLSSVELMKKLKALDS